MPTNKFIRFGVLAAVAALASGGRFSVVVAQSGPPTLVPFRGLIDHVSVGVTGWPLSTHVDSGPHAVSGDGRYVVMDSYSQDLVPNDLNYASDVFLRDRTTGTTTRVSITDDGAEANGDSMAAAISTNGLHVAFMSSASNLAPGDLNGHWDVFVRDLAAGRTVRVSVATDGAEGDADSGRPKISADGRFVVFISTATTFAPGIQPYGPLMAYVHDRDADGNGVFDEPGGTTTSLVSAGPTGEPANDRADNPRVSADGRFFLFESYASNLHPVGNPNYSLHLYRRDNTGFVELVDRAVTGGPSTWGIDTRSSDMSDDGRFITYTSMSPDIVPFDMDWSSQAFRYDAADPTPMRTRIVSALPDGTLGSAAAYIGTSVSADGRYVAFASSAPNLVTPAPAPGTGGLVVRDMVNDGFTRVDVVDGGAGFDHRDYPYSPALSADATAIAFVSNAQNAIDGMFTWYADHVFVATAFTASPLLASHSGNGGSGTIDVDTTAVSGWKASTYDSWITLMDGAGFGAGPRAVQYFVSTNDTGISRDGRIRVGSTYVRVHQDGDGDTTPPFISPTITGTIGGDGWYVGSVTVQFTVTDPDSEIVSQSYNCAGVTISTDTIYAPVTCEATSHGGTASSTVVVRIDNTSPSIVISTPAPSVYAAGSIVTPDVSCVDASGYSGVGSCVITEGSSPLDTTPGRHVFTVAATDRAGNSSSKSLEYLVGTGACVTPDDSLRAWWRFENGVADTLGHVSTVPVPVPTLQFASGVAGQSWQAQGQNYLEANDGQRMLAWNGLTIAAWLRPTGSIGGEATIVSKPAQYRIARFGDGTLRWAFSQTTGFDWVNTGIVLPTNAWTHVAVSYDNGLVSTYVNGRLAHSQQLSGTLTNFADPALPLTIGGLPDVSALYFGWIDELQFFTPAQPAATIESIALAGDGGVCVPSSTTLDVSAPPVVWAQRFTAKATLRDTAGNPVAGKLIEFHSTVGYEGYDEVAFGATDEFGKAQAELPTASSSQPGVYASGVRVRFDGDVHYQASQGASDETVIARTPEITWPAPAAIVYGQPLGGDQLNTSADTTGAFAYSPAAGTILDAGTHTLSATFTPFDPDRWTSISATRTIVVNKATPAIALADVTTTYDGQPHALVPSVTGVNSEALLPVAVTYDGATAAPANAGVYSVEARYAGSTNYAAVSRTATLTILKAATSITWTPPTFIVYGTALNVAQLNASANVPGTFTYSPPAGTVLHVGSYTLSATFTPSDAANYGGSSASRTLLVAPATLTIVVNSVSKPFGAPLPAFSVTTSDFVNGDSLASLNGTLTFSTPATASSPVGSYPVSVQGVSSPDYAIRVLVGTLTIVPASTTTVVAASPNPSGLNQAVTFVATVSIVAPGAGAPTGAVSFFDGGTLLGTVPLAGASASLTTNGFTAGGHAVSATYSGDASFAASSGGSTLTVQTSTLSSTTSVSSSSNPVTAGQNVTLTATVNGPSSTSGSVAFYDGAVLLGTVPLSLTTARLTTNALATGGHAITAKYLGDATVPPSTSAAFAQFVQPPATKTRASTVALVASPSPAALGSLVTLTATVTGSNHQAPTGRVTFFVNGFVVGDATLSATGSVTATAAFAAADLPHGTHAVEAVYLGDATFRASATKIALVVN